MSKKAVFILAPEKFRDEEYSEPKLILESAGIETFTASSRMGIAHGKLGLKAKIDLFLPDLKPQQFDAVIFVGGPGCYDYSEDPVAWRIAREYPRMLGNQRLLTRTLAGMASAYASLGDRPRASRLVQEAAQNLAGVY